MPGNPLTDASWAANLADTIENFVATIRAKTTKPLLLAYRGVIFGILAVISSGVALVMLIIALIRAFQAFLDIWFDHSDSVWISYLVLGVIFTIGGLLVMKKRFPIDEAAELVA